MADPASMSVAEAASKFLCSEQADVVREAVRSVVYELMELEVAELTVANARPQLLFAAAQAFYARDEGTANRTFLSFSPFSGAAIKAGSLCALGGTAADYDQFGAGINIGRAITKKLSGALAYQFVRESSGQSGLNYTVNIVSLNFSYQF